MTENGRNGGKVPISWLLGLLTTVVLVTVGALWAATVNKADEAKAQAAQAMTKAKDVETDQKVAAAQFSEILRRLGKIEALIEERRR